MKCTGCSGEDRVKKVVLDTNFLLIPHENKLDIFSEIKKLLGSVEFLIPEPVIKELHLISSKNAGAKVALEMLEGKIFSVVGSEYDADDAVISVARDHMAYVASMDAKVRKRTRESYLKLITLRGKDRIIVED
ncbi:MAG: hypothetical protein GOV00_02990 [Candidatus Altiarchaeota archaeon]|nr:hypothetical protein [Candidatus Altiarchaeota archaeon]